MHAYNGIQFNINLNIYIPLYLFHNLINVEYVTTSHMYVCTCICYKVGIFAVIYF